MCIAGLSLRRLADAGSKRRKAPVQALLTAVAAASVHALSAFPVSAVADAPEAPAAFGGSAATASSPRPRIGLALGGGGAKGAAHVGVLTMLEDMRIPIDCIVGTSMGALVGGTFASGMDAQEL